MLKYVNSEISAIPLCLGNVSNDFSVDYVSIDIDDILVIFKYVMVKHDTK